MYSPIFIKVFLVVNCVTAALRLTSNYRFCESKVSHSDFLGNELLVKFDHVSIPDWAKREFQYVNCSRRGLEVVPDISENVEFLDLSRNHLRRISAQDFLGLDNLTIIYLDGNCIKKYLKFYHPVCATDLVIEPKSFQNLKKLKILSLKYNYLREFPQYLPVSLSFLDISLTMLGNITRDLQKSELKLKALSAHSNCFKEVQQLCPRNFEISSKFSDSLQFLDIKLNSLEYVPKYLLSPFLDVFVLALNPITRLFKDDFDNATNLKVLLINGMKTINASTGIVFEEGVFDSLINLQTLDLSGNFIHYIPKNLFQYNTKLQYLDLSLNKLSTTILNPIYLEYLHLLRYLDVSSNSLDDRPKTQFKALQLGSSYTNLTSLESLMIGFPPIPPSSLISLIKDRIELSDMFDSISNASISILSCLKNLTTLSLSGLSFTTMHSPSWLKLRNLKSLYLSYNDINLQRKSNLFQKSSNRIKRNDWEIQKWKYNQTIAHVLPERFNKLTRSRMIAASDQSSLCFSKGVLDLSNNDVTSLANGFSFFLHTACKVDLSYNRIHFIRDKDFIGFSNLVELYLDHNPLYKIHSHALNGLNNLQVISMDHVNLDDYSGVLNFLTIIPKARNITLKWKQLWHDVFNILLYWQPEKQGQLDSISSLDLSGNAIPPFLADLFLILRSFQNLKILSLRNCGIVNAMLSITLGSVENSLQYLDLGANKLDQLPTNHSENLKHLETLKLDHNVISVLKGDMLSNLSCLHTFIISHNQLSYIQPGFFSHSDLRYLDLAYNYVARLGDDILPLPLLNTLEYLDIRGNDLDCSCDVWETFYIWTISPEADHVLIPGYLPKCTPELDDFYGGCVACQSPFKMHGSSLLSYNTNSYCGFTYMLTYSICFSSFFFFFLLSGLIMYSKRFKRFVFRKVNEQFRVQSLQQGDHSQTLTEFPSKVFVIYDLNDNEIGDWVDDSLSGAMKNANPSIPLSIIGKDDSCGVAPSQQILRRIMTCRKTVLILTNNFCSKPQCHFVLSALQEIRHSKGDDHLVLIAWCGDDGAPRVPLEIQETLNRRKQCFLRFDVTTDDEVMFFETLRTELCDLKNTGNE